MTLEEAETLVLREGYPAEDAPEDAVFLMLLIGYDLSSDPAHEQIMRLVEAVGIVHREIKSQSSIDKRLAGALYALGSGASVAKERVLSERENSDVIALFLAIEAAFFDIALDTEGA